DRTKEPAGKSPPPAEDGPGCGARARCEEVERRHFEAAWQLLANAYHGGEQVSTQAGATKTLDFSIGEGSDNRAWKIARNRRFPKVKARLGGVDESIGFNTRGSFMSCWVVPSLAAELWRMPLEQVLKLMRDGLVPSKEEEGFT